MSDEGKSGATVTAPQAGEPAQTAPAGGGEWKLSFDQLPEDLRQFEGLKKFEGKGPIDLVRAYANVEKLAHGRIAVPPEDAPKEQWDAFWQKLGRPESPDKYPEAKVPEQIKPLWNAEVEQTFRAAAHEIGLSARQYERLVDWYLRQTTADLEAQARASKEAQEKAWEELRKMWGPNTERNVGIVQAAVAKKGSPELAKILDETGIGNHPAFLKFAYELGQALLEDGELPAAMSSFTSKEAEAEIAKLESSEAYLKREHPDHQRVIERLRELYQVRYPS